MGIHMTYYILSAEDMTSLRNLQTDYRMDNDLRPQSEILNNIPDEDSVWLEKAWQGLHFLLTGTTRHTREGLGAVVLGGFPSLNNINRGMLRVFISPERVQEITKVIKKISMEELASRHTPDELLSAKIYCACGNETDSIYFIQSWNSLVNLFQKAANQGRGILKLLA